MAINTAIEFIIGTKRIFLPQPLVEVTNQDIFDSANNFLDEVQVGELENFVSAGGKDQVPGGAVGLTLNIFNGWTVEWEAEAGPGLTEKRILGNITAFTDKSLSVPADIFTPSANVFPLISQSFAPTSIEVPIQLTQAQLDAITADIMGHIIETGFTFEQIQRILASHAAGKVNQPAEGGPYQFRDINDTKDRIEGDDTATGGRDITSVDAT